MADDFNESINRYFERRIKFCSLLDHYKDDLEELGPFLCPSCGYPTISERGCYEICILCGWEDDGIDNGDMGGGPNHMTLNDSRFLFETNKKSNWAGSEKEKPFVSVRKRIIDSFERILVETDPIKRSAILKELPALYKEYGDILTNPNRL